jgi:Ni/Fe-hydrogenase 1 B-type cytochrome subunit
MAASQGPFATTAAPGEARDNGPTYVWELPVRIAHWTIVVSILVLTVTGLFMHTPFLRPSAGEAEPALMAQVRFIHELFAIAFTIAVGLRVYWAFAGNQYAHWRALVPHTRAQWRNLIEAVRFYGLRRPEPPPGLGHNALASVAYLVVYAGFAGQILTGLLLFGWLMETGPLDTLFGWGDLLPGGIQTVRLLHYFLTFLFIVFTIHHVYSSALTDVIERNGLLSSIVTGFKRHPVLPAVRPAEAAPAAVPEAPDA